MYGIRRAVADDAEEILRYCKIIGTGTDNLTFGAEGIGVSVENERQYLQNVFDSENDLYVIAEENCEIVGVCGLSSYKKERLAHRAKISLSVRKQMWGNRIGSELLRKSLEFSGKTKKSKSYRGKTNTDIWRQYRCIKNSVLKSWEYSADL